MNCDTAFDLMTDARGFRSTALLEHLECCPRCRQMQATLSPALEFLADHRHDDCLPQATAGQTGRALSSTVEGVKVAQQAAQDLAMRNEQPPARLTRLAGRFLRYAAVFAAGAALAFSLLPARERPELRSGACTRGEALGSDPDRSAEKTRALLASCLACHDRGQAEPDRRSSWFSRRQSDQVWGEADWLAPLLAADCGTGAIHSGGPILLRASAAASRTAWSSSRAARVSIGTAPLAFGPRSASA
jgi:hypothetical protein